MRAGRMTRRADEADRGSRGQQRTRLDARLEVRKVAVRPAAPVPGTQGEADAAVSGRHVPGALDHADGEGVERRARGSRDVGGWIVVMVVADRDVLGAASDWEDVVAVVDRRRDEAGRARRERARKRVRLGSAQGLFGLTEALAERLDLPRRCEVPRVGFVGALVEREPAWRAAAPRRLGPARRQPAERASAGGA